MKYNELKQNDLWFIYNLLTEIAEENEEAIKQIDKYKRQAEIIKAVRDELKPETIEESLKRGTK